MLLVTGPAGNTGPGDAAHIAGQTARLVGHASTRTTEILYRRELRSVITTGAEIMDELFSGT